MNFCDLECEVCRRRNNKYICTKYIDISSYAIYVFYSEPMRGETTLQNFRMSPRICAYSVNLIGQTHLPDEKSCHDLVISLTLFLSQTLTTQTGNTTLAITIKAVSSSHLHRPLLLLPTSTSFSFFTSRCCTFKYHKNKITVCVEFVYFIIDKIEDLHKLRQVTIYTSDELHLHQINCENE